MENNEKNKALHALINHLEQQLNDLEQHDFKLVRRNIEEHFERCIHALEARQAFLLDQLDSIIEQHYEKMETIQNNLYSFIQDCNEILRTGALIYGKNVNAAELVWQGALTLEKPECSISVKLKIDMSEDLLSFIANHGTVEDVSPQHPHSIKNSIPESKPILQTPLLPLPLPRFSEVDVVTTVAGSVRGQGHEACFDFPTELCWNPNDDCFYICDTGNDSIRKLTPEGKVSTFAGIPKPWGIAINHKENSFFVSSFNNSTITKITAKGTVCKFANITENEKGILLGIAIDQQTSDIFVCNDLNKICKISPTGKVSLLAGSVQGFADGSGEAAKFKFPCGMCYDQRSQSLLVCDGDNHKLRRVEKNGYVSTMCSIPSPNGIAVCTNGTILVSSFDNTIYKVTQRGKDFEPTVLAGSGRTGTVDGKPQECSFNRPCGLAVHEASHSCFVVDRGSHTIRKISFVNS